MKIKINKEELLSGLVLVLIGGLTIVGSLNYKIGTLARMGPGYFPLIIGVIIAVLGLMLLFKLSDDQYPQEKLEKNISDFPPLAFKNQVITWVLVISSVLAFIILSKYGGLLPATFFLVFISAFADNKNNLKIALSAATVLTLFTVAVFHFGLRLQMPLLGWG